MAAERPQRVQPWQEWRGGAGAGAARAHTNRPRREGGRGCPGDFLPDSLRARYTFVEALSTGDGRAPTPISLYRGEHGAVVVRRGPVQRPLHRATPQELRVLDHPGLLRAVDDPVEVGGALYEFYEHCPGGDLRAALPGERGPELAQEVLRSVGPALIYLHTLGDGLVHRDVKPDNILRRGDGTWVLGDLELVTHMGDESARSVRSSVELGTWAYMPPEAGISAEHDWYSFGLTLVEALTGEHPFARVLGIDHVPQVFADIQEAQGRGVPTLLEGLAEVELGADADRWTLLLSGLLHRLREHRWGDSEVAEFLDGGTPELAPDLDAPAAVPAFEGYGSPADLGRALAADWDFARSKVAGDAGYRGFEGPFLEAVRPWLAEHGTAEALPVFGEIGDEQGQHRPDAVIAWLLKALLPSPYPLSLPVPGRLPITADLPSLAAMASEANKEGFEDSGPFTMAIESLYENRLLYHLSRDGQDPLLLIDSWWHWGFARYLRYRRWAAWRAQDERTTMSEHNRAILGEAGSDAALTERDDWELEGEDGAIQRRRIKALLLAALATQSDTTRAAQAIAAEHPDALELDWFAALMSARPLFRALPPRPPQPTPPRTPKRRTRTLLRRLTHRRPQERTTHD
jgi:serine/threonine protein kinase